MPWRSASCSLASPSETVHSFGICGFTSRQPRVVETAVRSCAGNAFDGLGSTHGARVIDSTPPASTRSASPVSMVREAIIAASRLDPQSRLTVVAGTPTPRPPSRVAIRATLRLSSPAPLALPSTTSSTSAGSTSCRASSAVSAVAARSSGRTPARAPLKRPNGVRTPSYRKAVVMPVHLLGVRNANVCALNEHIESTPPRPVGSTVRAILGR